MLGHYMIYIEHMRTPSEWEFTGRIKYTHWTEREPTMSLEITYPRSVYREEESTGHLWWRKVTKKSLIKKSYAIMWMDESCFKWLEEPEETIYECTTTSLAHGESRSEDNRQAEPDGGSL